MAKKKRSFTRKRKALPKGFDSYFELDLYKSCLSGCELKPECIEYTVQKVYNPDFKYENLLIEAKGRFRDSYEASKYLWIRDHLPEGIELVFVFANPCTPMPFAKKRKDGTRRTMAEWAEKHGFTYYSQNNTPKEWRCK